MKIRNIQSAVSLAAVILTASLYSCQKENLVDGNSDNAIKYAISVSGNNAPDVKSTIGAKSVPVLEGIHDLTADDGRIFALGCIAGTSRTYRLQPETYTKGTLVNTDGDNVDELDKFIDASGDNFKVTVYNGTTPFIEAGTVKYADGSWVNDPVAFWPQKTTLGFYAYANLPDGNTTVEVDHTKHIQKISSHTVPQEASKQTDILISGYEATDGGSNGEVELTFHHPLTAVQFKMSKSLSEDGKMADNVDGIESITIHGVYSQGTAEQANASPSVFNWDTSDASYISVSQGEEGSILPLSDETTRIAGEPFILIPQEITSLHNISITVVLSINGHGVPCNATLNTGSWEAGMTYTYVVGYSDELDFETSEDSPDEPSQVETSGFVITNTGNVKCYARVKIVGNVVNESREVTHNWNPRVGIVSYDNDHNMIPFPGTAFSFTVTAGTFGSSEGWGEEGHLLWKAGADGFYYYTQPIDAGDSSIRLFDSYEQTGLKELEQLEMVISSQTVQWDENQEFVRQAWGEAACALLSK